MYILIFFKISGLISGLEIFRKGNGSPVPILGAATDFMLGTYYMYNYNLLKNIIVLLTQIIYYVLYTYICILFSYE